ncbi:hypothetical protein VZT92_008043 [Zoarces viviparus]|uniref:Deoxyribonuclease n=1 Tax=Zoarces viviparus TaxID=48416 RepID=A0AAW1FM65_ZOAVI
MRWVCVSGLLLVLLHLSTSLLLGAFNIQTFGITKASNLVVMNIISEIVCRYDIILIQEVRDKDLKVTIRLMTAVNNRCPQYLCIPSKPLGATSYKERYLFLFRVLTVSVVEPHTYTYDDTRNVPRHDFYGRFSYPPFIVEFSSKQTAVEKFVLIAQHTSPDKAVKQINALYDVVTDVRKRWDNNNIVLLGDFNAGGDYVSRPRRKQLLLSKKNGFHWLITDDEATSVKTGNPYDRIVVTDDMMKGVDGKGEVFNFMEEFVLTEQQALAVSDHFPVEVKLKKKTVAETSTVNRDHDDCVGEPAVTMQHSID